MIMAEPEHIFSLKQVEKWINKIGGVGTQVIIPKNAYYINEDNNLHTVLTPVGLIGVVNKAVARHRKFWHVRFIVNDSPWHLLWAEMKDVSLQKPIKLYTGICKDCRSPARRCDNRVFCSNEKCRSRKVFKDLYAASMIEYNSKDNPIYFICDKCNKKLCDILVNAIMTDGTKGDASYCPVHGYERRELEAGKWYVRASNTVNRYMGKELRSAYHAYWSNK